MIVGSGVSVGTGTGVLVGVGAGVKVGAGVWVTVGVGTGVSDGVGTGVLAGVGSGTEVAVGRGVGAWVGCPPTVVGPGTSVAGMLVGETVVGGTSVGGDGITTGVCVMRASDPPQAMAANAAIITSRLIFKESAPVREIQHLLLAVMEVILDTPYHRVRLIDYSNGWETLPPTGLCAFRFHSWAMAWAMVRSDAGPGAAIISVALAFAFI